LSVSAAGCRQLVEVDGPQLRLLNRFGLRAYVEV